MNGVRKRSPTYVSWCGMRDRCSSSPGNRNKKWYSDKGISVCLQWSSFNVFLEDMGERPARTSIDRLDSSKGYYKENCRWATIREQNRNRRLRSNTNEQFISLSRGKYFIVNVRPFKTFCRNSLEEAIFVRNKLVEIKNKIDILLIDQVTDLEKK